jgi:hypothetical protein
VLAAPAEEPDWREAALMLERLPELPLSVEFIVPEVELLVLVDAPPLTCAIEPVERIAAAAAAIVQAALPYPSSK